MTTQMIQHLCKEMAGELYEENKRTVRFRMLWPDVRQFVSRTWPVHIPVARAILTDMLRRKDSEVSPHLKEQIFETLVEDRKRSAGKPSAKVGQGPMLLRPDQPGKIERTIFYDGK